MRINFSHSPQLDNGIVSVGDQVLLQHLFGTRNLGVIINVKSANVLGKLIATEVQVYALRVINDKPMTGTLIRLCPDSKDWKIKEVYKSDAGQELATLFTTNHLRKDEIVVKHTNPGERNTYLRLGAYIGKQLIMEGDAIAKLDKSDFFIEEISFGENMFNIASDADEPCEYCAEHGTMVCPDCITQDEQDSIR